jgi:peptidoglycan hydrolase-like protein with peptidoglycan-binding domain
MKKVYAISALILLGVVTGNVAHAEVALTADVKMGTQGEKVFMLQDFLRAEGHFNRASTGYFGPITAAALKNYQTANGLTATGVLDDATLVSIQDESASAEAVVDAAMDRHPEKVPNLIEAVKNILTDIDPEEEGSASKIAQLSWLLSALLK